MLVFPMPRVPSGALRSAPHLVAGWVSPASLGRPGISRVLWVRQRHLPAGFPAPPTQCWARAPLSKVLTQTQGCPVSGLPTSLPPSDACTYGHPGGWGVSRGLHGAFRGFSSFPSFGVGTELTRPGG